MKCPVCDAVQAGPEAAARPGKNTGKGVIDSRVSVDGGIRRRRVCVVCGHRFTTLEVVIDGAEKGRAVRTPGAGAREQLLELADRASEMAEAIRSELNEQTVLSI
jgi:transcriptional regulator NrdR family protein